MTDNFDDAIAELIDRAKRQGRISKRAFSQVCEQFILEPRALEAKFRLARGVDYRELKIKVVGNEKAAKVASEIARKRVRENPGKYQFGRGLCGEIAKNGRRLVVYVGSWPSENGLDHEFIDVKGLKTLIMNWSDLHSEFPSFAERMHGRG